MNVGADILAPTLAWTVWNVGTAAGAAHLPATWFRGRRAPPARDRSCRRAADGPLHVRRWKRYLPDVGAVLPGGTPKRHLARLDRSSLERYALEARRSEAVHWSSVSFVVCCPVWCPFVVASSMFVVAVLINVPCIVALRDARSRIGVVLSRPTGRARPVPAGDGSADPPTPARWTPRDPGGHR
jgi:hypothetical protein